MTSPTLVVSRRGAPETFRRFLAEWLFSPLDGLLLSDWLELLGRHGLSIEPAYWPRGLFTTAMATVNSAMAGLERLRFASTIESLNVRAPVFVLGHHRSGTTHLWNLLSQDPQFAFPSILQAVFPHSFLTLERPMKVLADQLSIRKRPQDNVTLEPDSPIEEERAICTSTFLSLQMARHFPKQRDQFRPWLSMRDASPDEQRRWQTALDTFARKLLVRHGADRTLLFKSPDHTAKVRLILERYPDARFIHIHRDPFVVFSSTHKMELRTLQLYAFHRPPTDDLDAFILWRYREMYDAFFEDMDQIPPGQLVELAFTDLERDPWQQLSRVYRELGLTMDSAAEREIRGYIAGVKGYRKNVHPELDPDTRRRVVDAWHPMFQRWGYDTR